jgi:DNA-directed RNA polymerase subunit RPC12/RpoP
MAELVVPECPRCGADIELRHDGTSGVCKYCDAQVVVLDHGTHSSESEIERRKAALELLRQDLANLQAQASGAQFRINAAESGTGVANARAAVLPVILFGMMAAFGGMMSVLFYILDISWVWGISRAMCPVVGAIVVIIGVAGIFGTRAISARMRQRMRDDAMRSPEYAMAVQELQALGPRIDLARQDVERADRELRVILLGPQPPL